MSSPSIPSTPDPNAELEETPVIAEMSSETLEGAKETTIEKGSSDGSNTKSCAPTTKENKCPASSTVTNVLGQDSLSTITKDSDEGPVYEKITSSSSSPSSEDNQDSSSTITKDSDGPISEKITSSSSSPSSEDNQVGEYCTTCRRLKAERKRLKKAKDSDVGPIIEKDSPASPSSSSSSEDDPDSGICTTCRRLKAKRKRLKKAKDSDVDPKIEKEPSASTSSSTTKKREISSLPNESPEKRFKCMDLQTSSDSIKEQELKSPGKRPPGGDKPHLKRQFGDAFQKGLDSKKESPRNSALNERQETPDLGVGGSLSGDTAENKTIMQETPDLDAGGSLSEDTAENKTITQETPDLGADGSLSLETQPRTRI